jgi:hypothetical protein
MEHDMPIAQIKPSAVPTVQPKLPEAQPKNYKSVVYSDENVPLHSLIAYASGAPWSVDFYSQVVGEHNDLREIDPGQSGVYQQYSKTVAMEIRVNTPLTSGYDTEKGMTTVTGSAIVYPFLVPNVSDYFVSDVADNRKALFRITQVDRKTLSRDSVYGIEYELVNYVDLDNSIYDNLESKVIKSYRFSKDRLLEGLAPILKEEEFFKVTNLRALYSDLVSFYFKNFYNKLYFTLILPGQEKAVYDSNLVNYILKIVETVDCPEVRSVKQIPTDDDPYLGQSDFWDLLLRKDYNGRVLCNNSKALVNKELFVKNSYIKGLAFSTIDYVLYPVDPDVSNITAFTDNIKLLSEEVILATTGYKGSVLDPLDNTFTKADVVYQIIKPVLGDDTYVLSEAFYAGTGTMSLLEILVKDYLQGKTIDLDMLYAITDKYRKWNRLEQFYYGPILLTLIKESYKTTYS